MTKTPEQMAVEWLKEEYGDTSNWTYMGQEMSLDAFYAGYHTGYNIAYELGFEEALKAQKTLTYIQAEIKKNNETS
jgi:hypothetical protein